MTGLPFIYSTMREPLARDLKRTTRGGSWNYGLAHALLFFCSYGYPGDDGHGVSVRLTRRLR